MTSMIDQEFSRVHTLGLKRPKNLASSIFELALDNCGLVDWREGKLSFQSNKQIDNSDSVELQLVIKENGIPSYFLDMLVSIDLDIPPAESVIQSIHPYLFIMSFDAPAFHIPMEAETDYLAVCLVASRIAWECKNSLILPEPSTIEEFDSLLMGVGIHTLTLGGSETYKKAKEFLSVESFWEPYEDPERGVEMDFESVDGSE